MKELDFDEDGVMIKPALLSKILSSAVMHQLAEIETRNGIRHAEKKYSTIEDVVSCGEIQIQAQKILGNEAKPVRVIYFDKTPKNNWLVSWHQDKTIAVNKEIQQEDWGPWSIKEGVHHVQVPQYVLENMLTIRLHLDSTTLDNGCLKIIPGSHKLGILKQEEIYKIVNSSNIVHCELKAGDALLMRPHVLHASSKALKPSHRRIIHIEYSSFVLPDGLSWA